MTPQLPVIFKRFPDEEDGSVIALFPTLTSPQVKNPGEVWIMSYMHVGQHSDASPSLLDELQPATEDEYKDLLNELSNSVGYTDLMVTEQHLTSGEAIALHMYIDRTIEEGLPVPNEITIQDKTFTQEAYLPYLTSAMIDEIAKADTTNADGISPIKP